MPKYRLKQDYSYVKAGTISEKWRDHSWNPLYVFKFVFKNSKIEIVFNKEEINNLLQKDIVEKLPEPKWRDEDMIEFAKIMVKNHNKFVNIYEFNFKSELRHYEQSRQNKANTFK